MKNSTLKRTCGCLAAALLVACGIGSLGSDRRLTLTANSPEAGLVGEFRLGEEVVYFEAHRGPSVDSISASFSDAQGRLLASRGDAVAEGTAEAPSVTDPAEAARSLELIGLAAATLAKEDLAAVETERDSLVELARSVSDSDALDDVPLSTGRVAATSDTFGCAPFDTTSCRCTGYANKPFLVWVNGKIARRAITGISCQLPSAIELIGSVRRNRKGWYDQELARAEYSSKHVTQKVLVATGSCTGDGAGWNVYGRLRVLLGPFTVDIQSPDVFMNCPQ